jgi:peptidoglycan hydrolase CwlO-like protein
MRKPSGLQRIALATTRWIGSPASIIIHSVIFIVAFGSVLLDLLPFDTLLLILNTIISLEAIYLALFNQLAINYANEGIDAVGKDIDELQDDIGEIQEDVGEIQEDVGEISEDDAEHEAHTSRQQEALVTIQNDLKKLMEDIERLKSAR